MIDRHSIEPTGEGIIINWRHDSHDGSWRKVPYTIDQAEEALKVWKTLPGGSARKSLVADMRAAIDLERAALSPDTGSADGGVE